MMKKYFPSTLGILILFAFNNPLFSQKFASTASEIKFYSEAPMENIEAFNKDGKSVISGATREIAFAVSIRGFHFKKPLMEEHFNENYMESEKFKTATFKGKINEETDFKKEGVYDVTASGKMNIHGVEKDYAIPGKLTIKGDKISLDSKFKVKVADHKIEIPQLVVKNIAEVVEVTVHFDYEEKK